MRTAPVARTVCLASAAVAALSWPAPARADQDPRAVELAERTMASMGGRAAFDAQRTLAFRFSVERDGKTVADRRHVWDRWDGRYRFEGKTRDGRALLVIMNVNTREGDAWLDGAPVPADSARQHVESAYGAYINDTYWLLMPWKWLDPGVTLTYEGEAVIDGRTFDVVGLSFGSGVGLTSNDRYWGYVARDTGLMERWEFLLQKEDGTPGEGARAAFTWERWVDVGGGVRLATRKARAGEGPPVAIAFPEVRMDALPAVTEFTPPAR